MTRHFAAPPPSPAALEMQELQHAFLAKLEQAREDMACQLLALGYTPADGVCIVTRFDAESRCFVVEAGWLDDPATPVDRGSPVW